MRATSDKCCHQNCDQFSSRRKLAGGGEGGGGGLSMKVSNFITCATNAMKFDPLRFRREKKSRVYSGFNKRCLYNFWHKTESSQTENHPRGNPHSFTAISTVLTDLFRSIFFIELPRFSDVFLVAHFELGYVIIFPVSQTSNGLCAS